MRSGNKVRRRNKKKQIEEDLETEFEDQLSVYFEESEEDKQSNE